MKITAISKAFAATLAVLCMSGTCVSQEPSLPEQRQQVVRAWFESGNAADGLQLVRTAPFGNDDTVEDRVKFYATVLGIAADKRGDPIGFGQVALLSFESAAGLDLNAEQRVHLMTALMDALVLDMDQKDQQALYQRAEQTILGMAESIEVLVDPDFDVDDLPYASAVPPRETRLPPGVTPDAIEDEALRAEYVQSIAELKAQTEHYNEQFLLLRLRARLYPALHAWLIKHRGWEGDAKQIERGLSNLRTSRAVKAALADPTANQDL